MHVGVIGFGYWGVNVTRNFLGHPSISKVSVCDSQRSRLEKARCLFPSITTYYESFSELLKNPDIEIIAVVTPIRTHFEIAKLALEQGKHVLVEKTMTTCSEQAADLIRLAEKKTKILAVDHTFVYSPVVQKIKGLIDNGSLGELWYYDSVRVNLGLFQHDVNVLWDLAAHDLAILLHLNKLRPVEVSACGTGHTVAQIEDIAYLTLYYENNFIGHLHANWLAPTKIRQVLIGGSEKMLVWDDLNPSEKLRVYDKGIDIKKSTEPISDDYHDLLIKYRIGDMHAPAIDNTETLSLVVNQFIGSLENKNLNLSPGVQGLEVVAILEAAEKSLRQRGQRTSIKYPTV